MKFGGIGLQAFSQHINWLKKRLKVASANIHYLNSRYLKNVIAYIKIRHAYEFFSEPQLFKDLCNAIDNWWKGNWAKG